MRNVQAIAEAAEWGSWPPGAWEAIVARGGHEAHLACPGRRRLKSVRRTFRPLGHKLQCTEEGADRPLRAAASDAKRGGAVLRRKGERVRAAAALLDVEGKDDAREQAGGRGGAEREEGQPDSVEVVEERVPGMWVWVWPLVSRSNPTGGAPVV